MSSDDQQGWRDNLPTDPNYWLRIPEFGVQPLDVDFEGFALPFWEPDTPGMLWAAPLMGAVGAMRAVAQRRFHTLKALKAASADLVLHSIDENGVAKDFEIVGGEELLFAFGYEAFMAEVERGVLKYRDGDAADAFACLAVAMGWAIALAGSGGKLDVNAIRSVLSAQGKSAADARHGRPGGAREKSEAIRAIWATGKYSSRDRCAEEECAALGMSLSSARKALRNTPEPS